MRIKSLSLKGFKTFYEKSQINFDPAISAVVGPNGCGKTNLLDGLRWVLGEQNPRLLRTDSMSQLISDGNDKLPKQGFAEVSMIVDSEGHKDLPEEIEIKRKLTRNGESLYFLNGNSCRLKDITDVVMTIGAGSRTFTVIPQGQIETYITAKAEDKRQLIDEAAGLGRYKLRRHETERKIILTKDNLERINDIKEEVNSQRASLKEQANKSNEYTELVEKYKRLEKLFYKKRYKELNIRLEDAKKLKNDFTDDINKIQESVNSKEKDLEVYDKEIKRKNVEIETFNNKILEIKGSIIGIESDIKTSVSENELISQELERLKTFKKESIFELEDSENTLEKNNELLIKINKEYNLLSSTKTNDVNEDDSEIDIRKRLFDAVERYSSQKTSINLLEKELKQSKIKKTEYSDLSKRSENQISELKIQMNKVQDDILNLEKIREKCKNSKSNEVDNLKNVQKNLEQINLKHLEINSQIEATKSRVKMLENIELNYGWLPEGIREFVNKLKGSNIEGILSDYIKPINGYEKAVESALGEKLKWILIDNSENTISAIEKFKQNSNGRGTFIPLDMRIHSGGSASSGYKNIIDCLECDLENRPFLASIFGETYVVDNISEAMKAKQDSPGSNFVTIDGEFFDMNGSVTVGSAPDNIIQIKEEIKKLNIEKDKYNNQIDDLVFTKKQIEEEIFDANSRISSFDLDIEKQNEKYSKLSLDMNNLKSNMNSEINSKLNIENLVLDLESEVNAKTSKINQIKMEIDQIVLEKKSYEEKFNRLGMDENENIKNMIIAKNKEDRERLVDQRNSLTADIETIKLKKNKLNNKILEISKKIILNEEKFEKNNEDYHLKQKDKEVLEENLEQFNSKLSNIKKLILSDEESVYKIKDEIKTLNKDINEKKVSGEQYDSNLHKSQIEIDQLLEQLEDVDYVDDVKQITDQEMEEIKIIGENELTKSKFYKLQKNIDNFGPVNLLAPQEYIKLNERFEFLESQIIDLENSLENLNKTISKIDSESQTAFSDTFNLISAKYDEYVKRLFGGGEGKLVLTNPDSLKDSGIEVMLKIGLKKYRNLKSYSGGERALAGIALLLSAYFVKPAPFLLLDEVDAPLDDKNIIKFGAMLEEISELSQVAIITHNKATMKFAKQLIGVTSRLEGISEVVPIDLPK
tara:strand:- start:27869 stop:31339 length:3471 start_codon:yes stop_codon:yes gene_type:complete